VRSKQFWRDLDVLGDGLPHVRVHEAAAVSHHRKADQVRIGVPSGEFGSVDARDISSALQAFVISDA
jgi:hypothetical protein